MPVACGWQTARPSCNHRYKPATVHRPCSVRAARVGLYGQANKRIRWMPWQLKAMKDVEVCDMPRGAGKQALIRGFPNGETQPVQLAIARRIHRCARRTRGTEISKYPEEQKSTEIPRVAMSERGSALKRFGMRRIRPSPLAEAPGKVRHSG